MKRKIPVLIITISLLLAVMSVSVQSAPHHQGEPPRQNAVVHVVGWGDTLYSIAQLYGVSVDELMRLNNMTDANYVSVGQKLYITAGATTAPSAISETSAITSTIPETYTVQRGDTLYSIAHRFGSTVAELARLNNIYDPTYIYVGQNLVLPGAPTQPTPTRAPAATFPTATPVAITGAETYYTVQAGDSLSAIALRYGTTAQVLALANNIANPALIHVSQRLLIPTTEGAPQVGSAASTPVIVGIVPNAPLVPSVLTDTLRHAAAQTMTVSAVIPVVPQVTGTVTAPPTAASGTPQPTGAVISRAVQWPTATPGPGNVPTLIPLEEKWLYRPVYPAPNLPDLPCRGGYIAGVVYDVNGVPLEGVRVKIYNQWDYETISVSKGREEPGVFDFVISGTGWWDMVVIDAAGQAVSSAVTVQYAEDVAADGPTCQNHVQWYKTR